MLQGRISISHTMSSSGDRITIRVGDETSKSKIIEIHGTIDDIGKAILTNQEVDCRYEISNLEKAGKVRESKRVLVPIDPCTEDRYNATRDHWKKRCDRALRPFEIEGWEARRADLDNSRNYTSTGCYVSFVRYVDKDQDRT